jgi:ATP-dependent DNA helicase RecQ
VSDPLLEVVKKHWGFESLRPLQREAMTAALEKRDSLVIMPTGGGKSLCYQAPALLSDGLTVVVSPLISLMKDQVDRLLSREIPAAFINSSLDSADRSRVQAGIARGEYRMIFVAPERFASGGFDQILKKGDVRAFAIDEAHCISHWGHDFRVDYRELGCLKREFPGASVHAFTATATPRVRDDIIEQLGLRDPALLVGDFFRPNLRYRAAVRHDDGTEDVLEEVRRHPGEAGIVYCIRRSDVDALARELRRAKVRASPYHAGMDDDDRTQTQDRFAAGEIDVVVATVAFGMGIDRADIRYVLHAAMPKSIEHYQQETGRAGRDGEPADCVLFFAGQDFQLWNSILSKNETGELDAKRRMLSQMYAFCTSARCRHRRLVEYFGQAWTRESCGSCDVCSGEFAAVPGSTVLAQKMLSCVARTGERYGPAYVADVLRGDPTDRIQDHAHDRLSTFGLLTDQPKPALIGWMHQMVDQGLLVPDGDYGVLRLTEKGRLVLRSEMEVTLLPVAEGGAPRARKRKTRRVEASAEARAEPASDRLPTPDQPLFEELRELRRELADARNLPAYMIFSDKSLRGMARQRPTTPTSFLQIHGVGMTKLEQFGERFMALIRSRSRAQ